MFFEDLYVLFLLNVLTTFSFFLIVPFPPALVGLWAVAQRSAEGHIVQVQDWWASLKRYFWPAWGWAALNGLACGLMLYNLRFYGPAGNFPLVEPRWLPGAFQGAIAAVYAFWVAGQLYVFPFLLEDERPHLLRALWRSFALVLEHPLYSLTVLLTIVVLLVLSTVAFGVGFFVVPAAVAVLTVVAARELLGKDDPQP
ncbi:MAG: hypothetical protein JXD18_01790 [Anaerolineae bacterium]|nr:hypothetical protein [Anaerolineae bacterium]